MTDQLNLLIVEDSLGYALELEQIASEVGYRIVATVDNSAEALDIIFSEKPDIILMDINIKGRLTGIDIAKRINHLNIPILYITSFNDEKTYQSAQGSNLVGYIVKPVDKLTLNTSLRLLFEKGTDKNFNNDKTLLQKNQDDDYIFFMKENVYHKINISEIMYIKSENNYCRFMFENNESYLIRMQMNEIEDILKGKKFLRCHRQYIINLLEVKKLNPSVNTLVIENTIIPISRLKKKEIMKIGLFIK